MTFCKEPKTKVNGIKKERRTKGLVFTFFITQSLAEISDNKTGFIPRSDLSSEVIANLSRERNIRAAAPGFQELRQLFNERLPEGFMGAGDRPANYPLVLISIIFTTYQEEYKLLEMRVF
ncbi:MAG TPA: hypothetical protein VFS22_01610 [Flavisolibacter sp.]|nr:hypothetical protein [Flavisolibacter sp.]